MKFADLSLRINHDIGGGREDQIGKLLADLTPFIQFCTDGGYGRLNDLLVKISRELGKGPWDSEFKSNLCEMLNTLSIEVARSDLGNFEPGFLSQRLDVFTSLQPEKTALLLCLMLKNDLIRAVLVRILKEKYQFVRNYSREYRIKDLIKHRESVIIADYGFAHSLIDNGCPAERIVYMDFRHIADCRFQKKLIYPFLIEDLDGIL